MSLTQKDELSTLVGLPLEETTKNTMDVNNGNSNSNSNTNDDMEEINDRKRAATYDATKSDDTKRPCVATTTISASVNTNIAAATNATATMKNTSMTTDHGLHKKNDDVVDIAVHLGLKAGDRLEVQWDLVDDVTGMVQTRWWGATLLEHDGRHIDGGCIRVLDYDPYYAGGFPEHSLEDVFFVNEEVLISNSAGDGPMGEGQVMSWRREGAVDGAAAIAPATVALDEESLREELNGMLRDITSKHSSLFQSLDAASQAKVAEKIARGKERLLAAIRERWEKNENKVISPADMHSILAETFGKTA